MQNNLNFNDLLILELNKNTNINDNVCLISSEKLEDDYIEFICKHKFNYKSIFYEILKQKKHLKNKNTHNNLEIQKLSKYQMKCPYCRKIQNGILPPKIGWPPTRYINWPPSQTLQIKDCIYKFITGKRKSQECGKKCPVSYCDLHLKIIKKREKKKEDKKIKAASAASATSTTSDTSTVSINPNKCKAITLKGKQCSRNPKNGPTYCYIHSKKYN